MHSPVFSLEVFPPKNSSPVGTIYDTLDGLEDVHPDFISVTYLQGALADRTVTARIAKTINDEYHIPAVAHLTALYNDEQAIDQALDMFEEAGVKAVLALRGDFIEGVEPCGVFSHASDLAAYISRRKPGMRIYGACYPECHVEASNLQTDIDNLKRKIDAGVTRLITQLFYDNADFYRFVDLARARGIDVPIEAGIMPVRSVKSLERMTSCNGCCLPPAVKAMADRWRDNLPALKQAGMVYASQQIADLVAHGVDGVHLYAMNRPRTVRKIWANVSPLFDEAA
ncbi:5,10-methylenetetrahydrofolate reductase (NAD(P)) [Bifidobacterium bohemicum]|uniref:methylenetetrahydrofolate reductase n=1 Tax=Bifidobacterium bohemicum TaxID=638617 RepID=UPI000815B247|nr:methylenetetrahydrofolate reductase [Bifidobacterium bohemicum]SCB80008.1 5,10-methylenetetrahydrofolate reductase (NAD(P)) [Bifidobacterium bohemicum]